MRILTLEQYLAERPQWGGTLRADGRVDVFDSQAERDAAVPPAAPALPTLTPRQLRLALHGAGLLDGVAAAINTMPEPQRTQARITWEYATEYERGHPLVASLGAALGLTVEQIDALWQQAAGL